MNVIGVTNIRIDFRKGLASVRPYRNWLRNKRLWHAWIENCVSFKFLPLLKPRLGGGKGRFRMVSVKPSTLNVAPSSSMEMMIELVLGIQVGLVLELHSIQIRMLVSHYHVLVEKRLRVIWAYYRPRIPILLSLSVLERSFSTKKQLSKQEV